MSDRGFLYNLRGLQDGSEAHRRAVDCAGRGILRGGGGEPIRGGQILKAKEKEKGSQGLCHGHVKTRTGHGVLNTGEVLCHLLSAGKKGTCLTGDFARRKWSGEVFV